MPDRLPRAPRPLGKAPHVPRDTLPSGSRRHEIPVVLAGSLTWGGLFFDRFAPLYILLPLSRSLDAPPAWIGSLALVLGVAWATSMPVARLLSGRWSHRQRLLGATSVALALSLLSLVADNWAVFVALRAASALAAGTAAPAITGLAFAHVPTSRRGLDLGIVQSSTRLLGTLLAPTVVTAVLVTAGWRAALAVSAGMVLVGAVSVLALVPGGSGLERREDAGRYSLQAGGRRNLLVCVGVATLLLTWLLVVGQVAIPLLTEWLQVDQAAAGRLLSVYGVGAWLAAIGFPALSDRIGRSRSLMLASAVGGIAGLGIAGAAVTGMLANSIPVVAVLLLAGGTAMGGLPLVISIIPAEAVASGDVGRALEGPIVGTEILGGAVLPAAAMYLAGYLDFALVVGIAAGLLLAVLALAPLIRE